MITSGLGVGNIDLRFHLRDKTNKFYKMETVRSINTASLFEDDRPMDIYLDAEDINRIISVLQTLKEKAGYKLNAD